MAKHYLRFVPLPYRPENNAIPMQTPPTGFDALRTLAVSRIYLDNFDHIHRLLLGSGPETGSRGRPVGDQGLARGYFPLIARLQAAGCEGMLTGMSLETQITQTRRAAMSSDPKIRNGSHPQALIQEIATRRYFGHGGAWTVDLEEATDFRSAAAAMEHAQQLNFVMVQLVLSGNLTVCEVIPSTTAAST